MVKWGGDLGQIVHKRKQGHFPLGFSHKTYLEKMSSFPAHWMSTVNSETPKTSRSFVLRMYFWMCHSNEKFPFSFFIFSYTIALKLYSVIRLNVLQCFPECMVFSVSYTFFSHVLLSSLSIHPSRHLISCRFQFFPPPSDTSQLSSN